EHPERPLAAMVGGAKVSTKLDLLNFLLEKVDVLVTGGAMANTLLLAEGKEVGAALVERDMVEAALAVLDKAKGKTLILPLDAVVAEKLEPGVSTRTVAVDAVPAGTMILDVGPATVAEIAKRLAAAKTLVWNGPLGAFETKPFDAGTVAVAKEVAALTRSGKLLSVAGGGDTVAALHAAGVA